MRATLNLTLFLQDLAKKEAFITDGVVTLKFSRKRDTGDSRQDAAFTDENGLYLIFPVKGGDFNAANKKIRKHGQTPTPSAQKISIKACRNEDGTPTFTTTPKPAQLMYQAKIKFVDLGERYRLPVRGSREYTELKTKISKALKATSISSVPGFQDVVINRFRGTDKVFGEFLADMMVVVNKDEYESKDVEQMTVEKAVGEVARGGRVGNLKVDPESLELKAPGKLKIHLLNKISYIIFLSDF